MAAAAELTQKDFKSDQDVRWCPGCGDYSVLANVQRVMPELGEDLLRDRYLAPAQVLGKVEGQPFKVSEIRARIERMLAEEA